MTLLAFLGVEPADLPPAPDAPTRGEHLARITPAAEPEPCVVCGVPAWLTYPVDTTAGRRWLDLCRPHRLAVADWREKHAEPRPPGEALTVLRQAAEESGLRVRVIASGGGD